MKRMIMFLIFISLFGFDAHPNGFAVGDELFFSNAMLIETPNGEKRIRYEQCDHNKNCRIVEQTISYPLCDEHHNCQIVDAVQSGTAKLWEEEELSRRGQFVFSAPLWQ